jgi:putative integral membrane protein (TIGR02587 family)
LPGRYEFEEGLVTGSRRHGDNAEYAIGLARAAGGAILFAFPLMMTMEMWQLGFYLDRLRLFVFLVLGLAMLVPLSRFVGFEHTSTWTEDALDALAAFGIGILASALLLALFALIGPGMGWNDVVGKIAVQAVPASFGAVLARTQMAAQDDKGKDDGGKEESHQRRAGYTGQLFIMAAGALFLAFNVAPTEEMILIAFKMTAVHAIALVLFSILLLHAFVYALGFGGQEELPEKMSPIGGLINYSMAGYGIALIVSLYVLWTFGRTDGVSARQIATMVAVMGFPSALGAASARLVV